MSTIFTNQTPWITLADAFGVFFAKKSGLSFAKNVDQLLSLVPSGEPLFRDGIMTPVITSCTPWISLADALGAFFTKTRKFWMAVSDVLGAF